MKCYIIEVTICMLLLSRFFYLKENIQQNNFYFQLGYKVLCAFFVMFHIFKRDNSMFGLQFYLLEGFKIG